MAPDDHRRTRTRRHRRINIGLFTERKHHAAHQTRHARNFRNSDGEDHILHRTACQRHQRNRQQDRRDGHHAIHDAHDDAIGPTDEAGNHPNGEANDGSEQSDRKTDQQRNPRTVKHARIDIAPEHIRAKPKHRRWFARTQGGGQCGRVLGEQQWRENRDQHHQRDQ